MFGTAPAIPTWVKHVGRFVREYTFTSAYFPSLPRISAFVTVLNVLVMIV